MFAPPIHIVVTGDEPNCRVHVATIHEDRARAFAAAFPASDAKVLTRQYPEIGGDFSPGLKPFVVTMAKDGTIKGIDGKPGIDGFGFMNGWTDAQPDVNFHVWSRNPDEAKDAATRAREFFFGRGRWPI